MLQWQPIATAPLDLDLEVAAINLSSFHSINRKRPATSRVMEAFA